MEKVILTDEERRLKVHALIKLNRTAKMALVACLGLEKYETGNFEVVCSVGFNTMQIGLIEANHRAVFASEVDFNMQEDIFSKNKDKKFTIRSGSIGSYSPDDTEKIGAVFANEVQYKAAQSWKPICPWMELIFNKYKNL
jgi:hypothetical protein